MKEEKKEGCCGSCITPLMWHRRGLTGGGQTGLETQQVFRRQLTANTEKKECFAK